MAEQLGADVDALEQVGTRLGNASSTATTVQGSLSSMAGDLRFYGRYGDEFTSYVSGTAAPALGRVAEEMSSLSQAAIGHAQAQRQVSDGDGAGTLAAAGAAGAGLGGAATLAQRRGQGGQQRQQREAPAQLGTRAGRDRAVDYPDGERRVGGTRAWRNNNPGNLRWNDGDNFARDHGAIGRDYDDRPNPQAQGGYMAVFPDRATGERAQEALLQGDAYRERSIAGAIGQYAPATDRNNVERYIRAVTQESGLNRDTTIGELNQTQFNDLIRAMRNHENSTPGRTERVP